MASNLRDISLLLARVVRDHLEDLHCAWTPMTDENMPKINTAIRKGIYQWLSMLDLSADDDEKKRHKAIGTIAFRQPPDYWETNCFDEVDEEINNLLSNNSL